jgi:hypothetical protein
MDESGGHSYKHQGTPQPLEPSQVGVRAKCSVSLRLSRVNGIPECWYPAFDHTTILRCILGVAALTETQVRNVAKE